MKFQCLLSNFEQQSSKPVMENDQQSELSAIIDAALLSRIYISKYLPYIDLQIGTPGQTISFVLDTGSYRTIIPCMNNNKAFNVKVYIGCIQNSSTNRKIKCAYNITPYKCYECSQDLKCTFSQGYLDGRQFFGYYTQDQVEFGQIESLSASQVSYMGCITQMNEGDGSSLNRGVIGLMHYNSNFFPNIIDQFTVKSNRSFAICLNGSESYMTIGLSNGTYKIPYYLEDLQYTIKVFDIKSEGLILNQSIRQYTFSVDTGANTIVIPNQLIYDALQSHFHSYASRKTQVYTGSDNSLCVMKNKNHKNFFDIFPTYTFELENGFEYTMQPQQYLILIQQYYCFAITYLPNSTGIILGTPFMLGWEFTFDQKNKQIHFTENCSYESISQTLLTDQNIIEALVINTPNNEPNITEVDTGKTDDDYENQSSVGYFLLMILIILLTLMIILIKYYLRRIKLIQSHQQDQQILIAEVKSQN